MARPLHADLAAAQIESSTAPLARLIARKTRLEFSLFAQGSNPFSITNDAALQQSEAYVYGAVAKTSSGTRIVRAWHQTGALRLQTTDDPATAVEWSHGSNPWVTYGTIEPDDYTGLSISTGTGVTRLWLVRNNSIYFIQSTDGGFSWVTTQNLVTTGPGGGWVCKGVTSPHANAVIGVFYHPTNNTVRFIRYFFEGSWQADSLTERLTGYTDVALGATSWSTFSYISSAVLNGIEYLVYCLGPAGKTWVVSNRNQAWSNPRLVLPDDYSGFRGYRLTAIQGKLWLTGRVTRGNLEGFSPALEVLLCSVDGENWTHLSAEAHLAPAEIRGTLVLFGNYVYYVGIYSVYRAPATYLIDPAGDNPSQKLEISTAMNKDLQGLSLNFASAGTAPQLSAELWNGDDGYYTGAKAAIVRPGSEVWTELGYRTASGDRYASMLRGTIDQMPLRIADGVREADLVARCSAFKRLIDWTSPYYAELLSQLKHHDPCEVMDHLYIANGGDYRASSENLMPNGEFEENDHWWNSFVSGAADGLQAVSDDESYQGKQSLRVQKITGAAADDWGTQSAFSVLAGFTYKVTIFLKVAHISGGSEAVRFFVGGEYGANGASASVSTVINGVSATFEEHSLEITTQSAAVITVRVHFDNASLGTFYLDKVTAVQTTLGHIQFRTVDRHGVLFSTDPLDVQDCDVRMRGRQVVPNTITSQPGSGSPTNPGVPRDTGPYSGGGPVTSITFGQRRFGPIVCGVDQNNYIALCADIVLNRLDLIWMNDGIREVLDFLSNPVADGLKPNTSYDVRLVHRSGVFYCYVKPADTVEWGNPQLTYTWNKSTPPIPTANGRGKVGVYTYIKPLGFRSFGVDPYSRQIPFASLSGDWNSFPSSGKVIIDDEIISYTRKTISFTVYPTQLGFTGTTNADEPWRGAPFNGTTRGGWYWGYRDGRRLQWANQTMLGFFGVEANFTRDYTGYALVWIDGAEPLVNWEVKRDLWGFFNGHAYDFAPGHDPWGLHGVELDEANSGHVNTNGQARGLPEHHAMRGAGNYTLYLAPALLGCTRGLNGTEPAAHDSTSLVYEYRTDYLLIEDLLIFDYERDHATEDLLARICGMAGVFNVGFDNAYPQGVEPSAFTTLPTSPYYGLFSDPQWLGPGSYGDVDLRFTFSTDLWASVSSTGIAVWLRASTTNPATLTGLVVEIDYTASRGGTVDLYNWIPGAPVLLESFTMLDPPIRATTVETRVVVTGEFITVYLNDAIQACFRTPLYPAQAVNRVGLGCRNGEVNYTSVRIPELFEWREAFYVDNDESASGALRRVIEDRAIRQISRSGETVKFASFDQRVTLPQLSGVVVSDTRVDNIADVFSMVRVYAEEIMEATDPDLLASHGLILRTLQMSRASVAVASQMMLRLFRYVKETLSGRQIAAIAQLNWEPEDKVVLAYTASATGLMVAESLIVNDLTYQLTAGPEVLSLTMSATARKWVS